MTKVAAQALRGMSRPVKTRKENAQVATISARNDPTIGELVADAMESIGDEGVITVEEPKTETALEAVEGMRFDRGFLSPYFVTPAGDAPGIGRAAGRGIREDEYGEIAMHAWIASAIVGVLLGDAAMAQSWPADPALGREVALQVCAPCHVVTADQYLPDLAIAPDFSEIANTPGMTETALYAFLQSPHPTMPNLRLEPEKATDLIAYILSLRGR